MRATDQREAGQEQDARQPRLAMESDRPANTKTRERTEGAATAVQAMRGNSCSVDRVDLDPMCSTRSGDDCTGPPAPPCSGENALVDNRAAASKSCLLSMEMHSPTAAGGLVPTGKTPTATKTTYNETILQLYATDVTNPKEKHLRTSVSSVSYDSSFWKLLAAPSCLRVIETKSMQNRTLDPGGSQGRFRACPFLGSWRVLFCGEVMHVGAADDELQRFSKEESGNIFTPTYCGQSYFLRYGAFKKVLPSRAAQGYTN